MSSMNPWRTDNGSLTEAFLLMSSDFSGPPIPSQASSSTANIEDVTEPPMPSSERHLAEHLLRLLQGFRECSVIAFQESRGRVAFLEKNLDYLFHLKEHETPAKQKHRMEVLRELNSLISGSLSTLDDDVMNKCVSDDKPSCTNSVTEYFDTKDGFPKVECFKMSGCLPVTEPDRLVTLMGHWQQDIDYHLLRSHNGFELSSSGYFRTDDKKWITRNLFRYSFNFDGIGIRSWPQNQPLEAFNCMFDLIKRVKTENLKLRKLEREVREKRRALAEAETRPVEMEQNLLRESMNTEQLLQKMLEAQNEVGIFRTAVERECCEREKAEERLVKLNEDHSKMMEDFMKKFAMEAKMWAAHAFRYGDNQALNAESNRIYTPDMYDSSLGFQAEFSRFPSPPPPPPSFAMVAGEQRQQRLGLLDHCFNYLKLGRR